MSEAMGPALPGMRCVKFLGAGGFADVYLYERDQPRIKVAVKVMKPGALTEAQRRQFTAEADTMALLAEHPYIVPVLGAGTSDDGRPYLVMTYFPSSDLAARVAQNPLSIPEALRYGIQLASAVETAHRSGVIHRDIKPSNILMSSYGVMGLSDFGIAGRPTDLGQEDEVGISLPWSPREVVVGDSNGSVQSDVYSLAATVWHLMMGRAPFYVPGGENTERATVTRIVHGKPSPLDRPDAPASLDRLLQQAMSKDPAYRPYTALELAQHFQRIEQEMRLARTEIVVLDQGATVAPTAEPSALDATDVWGRATGPGSGGQLTAPGPTLTPRVPAEDGATELKPPTRVVAQAPIARAAATSGPAIDKPTDLRPPRVDPTPALRTPTAEEDPEESGPSKRGWLIGAAVVLLGTAIAGGFVLTSGGGGGTGGNSPTEQPPVDGSLTGVTGVDPLPPVTGLTATLDRDGATIHVTWDAVPNVTTYRWSYDGKYAAKTISTNHVDVSAVGAPGQTCVRVLYITKSGAPSPLSPDKACG